LARKQIQCLQNKDSRIQETTAKASYQVETVLVRSNKAKNLLTIIANKDFQAIMDYKGATIRTRNAI